jgi:hypothetical protein
MQKWLEKDRVAQSIRRIDSEGTVYRLEERLRLQIAFYPFCELKDLIDATSRIYDMELSTPAEARRIEEDIEPEYFEDS